MFNVFNIILGGDFICEIGSGMLRNNLLNDFSETVGLCCTTIDVPHDIPYTFINSLNQSSFIDNFFVSIELRNKINSLTILDDGVNLSDHIPLILDFRFDATYVPDKISKDIKSEQYFRVSWNDANSEEINHQEMLADML